MIGRYLDCNVFDAAGSWGPATAKGVNARLAGLPAGFSMDG
jgi:hypothetical protein